ncbi:MAG: OmpA family protein [Sandaracinaceae bacterium]|nr:OmpA family protein [Sandaracinaceae bacterium]
MRSWMHWLAGGALAVGSLAAVPLGASAQNLTIEPWYFTADIGVAGPIDDESNDLFSLGGDGSVGVYRSFIPQLSLGARLRVGILGEGEGLVIGGGTAALEQPPVDQPPVDTPVEPPPPTTQPPAVDQPPTLPPEQQVVNRGVLDYEYITANLRVRPLAGLIGDDDRRGTGLYIDAGAGVGLLEGDFSPAFNAAIGWNFGLGPVALGPKFRFTHMMNLRDEEESLWTGDVFTWMGGLEVVFMDGVGTRAMPTAEIEAEMPRADVDLDLEEPRAELDVEEEELDEDVWAEPETEVTPMVNDALVVDERVFFDYDSSELRDTGREQLDEIVEHYRQYGERYDRLIIGGHADSRGTIDYNEGLSRDRAAAVVDYLASQGIPRDRIEVQAHGELLPAIPDAQTEFEHQVNRRVAFRVEWAEGQEPVGVAPEAEPTMPDYVDEAPQSVQERERRASVQEREARERELAQSQLENLGEQDRLALMREREGTARLESEAMARAELEAGTPEARAQLEAGDAQAGMELEASAPQARVELDEESAID